MSPELLKSILESSAVSPYEEMIAYEMLYAAKGTSLKKMADMTVNAGLLPSQAAEKEFGLLDFDEKAAVEELLASKVEAGGFSVAVNNTPSWPDKLADSERPSPLFYYRGDLGLMDARSVSVVGSRKASQEGKRRAYQLARDLTEKGIAVVSGLAKGIDTEAMKSAMEHGGRLIGVIGTPIDEAYPRENADLQEEIARKHLLVSQVPFYKYQKQPFNTRRYYFPERNELMAAISDATVIVEASDTSGTLTQARACQHQRRKLFIMKSCYENDSVDWPKKWAEKDNVYVVGSTGEIVSILYEGE